MVGDVNVIPITPVFGETVSLHVVRALKMKYLNDTYSGQRKFLYDDVIILVPIQKFVIEDKLHCYTSTK
jgi:hypothetical protein